MSDLAYADRRSTRTAVVLAVLFLATIGAAVGWITGASAGSDTGAQGPLTSSSEPVGTPSDPPSGDSGDSGGSGSGEPGNQPSRSASPRPSNTYPPPSRTACPGQLIDAAKKAGSHGELKLRLYVKTNASEVWICMDAEHKLFYQGHMLGKPFPSGTSNSTLFLTDVEARDHDYLATRHGDHVTKYYVSMNAITVENHEGKQQTQDAVDCYTP